MRINNHLLSLFIGVCLLAGCSTGPQSAASSYDANSWKTMIPESCLRFYDGCNNCRRSAAGEVAACTRKACVKYQKPRCLDDVKQ
jgi:hypothetical protein